VADIVTPARRSEIMRRIRGKGTKPELIVRSAARWLGFRFRVHVRKLPDSPDLVFPGRKTALFVHGCFWHRHEGCPYCYVPKSNMQFWVENFKKNVVRDRRVQTGLEARLDLRDGSRFRLGNESESRNQRIRGYLEEIRRATGIAGT
jgi:DNA mismatch endonuclease, patch repair protein